MDKITKIDGFDISKVNLYSLRSQVGVVPQDSLLFDGSVRLLAAQVEVNLGSYWGHFGITLGSYLG